MAETNESTEIQEGGDETIQLDFFEINGLFGYLNHKIDFPKISEDSSSPALCILQGQNGMGKTTIMQMISRVLEDLNFDLFREMPFTNAKLALTDGSALQITKTKNLKFPLKVSFCEFEVELSRKRESGAYTPKQSQNIEVFRNEVGPKLKSINFELLTIERTMELLRQRKIEEFPSNFGRAHQKKVETLSERVRSFLTEVQLNYRRFFETSQFDLFPHIMDRFEKPKQETDLGNLDTRISELISKNNEIRRFGLETDLRELKALREVLSDPRLERDSHAFLMVESYVEIHENRQQNRKLILSRLEQFEQLMDEFLVGKTVRVSTRKGLEIDGLTGPLVETDLSSGEYHFLYMMVAALLCKRRGTVIAIDEPELSLHVSWQRKLVSALTKCASGASPIFFFSTHSTAISAEHSYAVQTLSPIE